MMQQLDIQGYHDKSEGAERLLLWVDSALKAYRHSLAMEKHRIGLQYILDITPDLHRLQPLDELLQGLLWQVEGLMGAENSFLATYSSEEISRVAATDSVEGFVALVDSSGEHRRQMEIRVGTGRYRTGISTDSLPEPERTAVREAVQSEGICLNEGVSVVPLRLGEQTLGVIYVDKRPGYERDKNLLEIFACQAAAAIQSALLYGQNALLFDLATKDPTTGVSLRGYAMQQFHQHLKRAHRSGTTLSLLMVDLDRFKEINDEHGHIAGDRALRMVGDLLGSMVRETDSLGRYGGDEFMIVLPDTPAEGAQVVARRVMEKLQTIRLETETGEVPLHLSIGVGVLAPAENGRNFALLRTENIEKVATELIACADASLYSKKRTGEVGDARITSWSEIELSAAA